MYIYIYIYKLPAVATLSKAYITDYRPTRDRRQAYDYVAVGLDTGHVQSWIRMSNLNVISSFK